MCDHDEVDLEAALAAIAKVAEEKGKSSEQNDSKGDKEAKPVIITNLLVKALFDSWP